MPWIGHILRRNFRLQRVIEGKIKGGIEVTGRRGRRRRKLLDDLKERTGYSHLKEEVLDRTMWRARFGRGFGPVVRQTTKWMNKWMYVTICGGEIQNAVKKDCITYNLHLTFSVHIARAPQKKVSNTNTLLTSRRPNVSFVYIPEGLNWRKQGFLRNRRTFRSSLLTTGLCNKQWTLRTSLENYVACFISLFPWHNSPLVGHGILIIEASR
jgi:hypothetical protein